MFYQVLTIILIVILFAFAIIVATLIYNFHTDILERIDELRKSKTFNEISQQPKTEEKYEEETDNPEESSTSVFDVVDDLLSGKISMEDK